MAAFDRAKIDVGFALRTTVGVAIPLVVALAAGHAALGGAAAVGALSAGFASQQGVYRTRAAAMLWTSSGMALSAFVGGLVSQHGVGVVVAMALWGYAYGIVASLGPAATAAGLNSLIALVVFSNLNVDLPPLAAAQQAACVFAGGAVQTLLLVVVWPLARFTVERRGLARAYGDLAAYARSIAGGTEAPPSSLSIATVRSTLADPQPFAARGEVAVFQSLLDEAERIRGSLGALATTYLLLPDASVERESIEPVAAVAADVLGAVATALRDGRAPRDRSSAWGQIRALEAAGARAGRAGGDAAALFGQLRAAWRLARSPSDEKARDDDAHSVPWSAPVPRVADAFETLTANLHLASPFGRLAIRLAVTLAAATALYRTFDVRNGYWMALTIALLLKPDFSTTVARGIARVAGTLIGAGVATAIAVYAHPSAHVDVALCIAFAALGYVAFNANYAAYTVTITAYVIFLLALLGQPEQAAVAARIVATLAGAVLAGVATLVWPTWESPRSIDRLAELIENQRRYAALILDAYVAGTRGNGAALREAQTASWTARAAAEASVDAVASEPGSTHALAVPAALGILAASRRIGLGMLALNVHLATAERRGRPWLATLAAALCANLDACAAALRERRAPPALPPLRPLFDAARAAAGEDAASMLLAELDFILDGINTLRGLVREAFAPTA